MSTSSESLAPYLPGVHGPWGPRHAFHLLERSGFGASSDTVEFITDLGPDDAVDFLLRSLIHNSVTPPEWLDEWTYERGTYRSLSTPEERQAFRNKRNAHMRDLQAWWLRRMLDGPQPFIEKLTLFWHSHFAVSAEKVNDPVMMYHHINLFRENGGGNFRDLVKAVCIAPAMVIFLDSASNVKGRPNENFARELMELYTMGEGNGYTEKDVLEASRALTGWRVRDFESQFAPRHHDDGPKTFLGKPLGETGALAVNEIVDRIVDHPATARFVSRKLFTFFAHENPSEALVDEMAAHFRAVNFQIRPFLATVFKSKAFFSTQSLRGLVKSPVQLVVGTHRKLQTNPEPPVAATLLALRQMGQELLWPPDVDGWKEGHHWINSNALMMRYHWLHFLTTGEVPNALRGRGHNPRPGLDPQIYLDLTSFIAPNREQDADWCLQQAALRLFGRPLPPARQQELVQYLTRGANNARVLFNITRSTSAERFRGVLYLLMSSPDYQLC
ncbi:MAG: DUF1800 domain-containing protein [Kiritimatiellae bacterium]|nr:DUF1800 domain-containing protein [Kiritimatiellia bacterium]